MCPPCPSLSAQGENKARRRLFGEKRDVGAGGRAPAPSPSTLDTAAHTDYARFRAAVMACMTEDELFDAVAGWQEEEEQGGQGGVGAALSRAWAATFGRA